VQRRLSAAVDRVDVEARVDAQLDGLDRVGFGLAAADGVFFPRPEAGGGHQRIDAPRIAADHGAHVVRHVAAGGELRIGAVRQQDAHRREIGGPRGAEERRRAGAEHGIGPAIQLRAIRLLLLQPRVRTRAVIEQHRHQLQGHRPVVDHLGRRTVRGGHGVRVDGGVQRRPAARIGQVRIGAALDQEPRDVEVAVDDRGEERRDEVGIG
jgi:hypothetical protein